MTKNPLYFCSISFALLALLPFIHSSIGVSYNLQNEMSLSYDILVEKNKEIIQAQLIGADFLKNCTHQQAQNLIEELSRAELMNNDYTYNHRITSFDERIYILSEPDQLSIYYIENEVLVFKNMYTLQESDSQRLFSNVIEVLFDCEYNTVVVINEKEAGIFSVDNPDKITFNFASFNLPKASTIKAAHHACCGKFILSLDSSTNTEAIRIYTSESDGKSMALINQVNNSELNLTKTDIKSINVHRYLNRILIGDYLSHRLFMIESQDFTYLNITVLPGHLEIQNIEKILTKNNTIFAIGSSTYKTLHTISEFNLQLNENYQPINFVHTRQYTITSTPLSYYLNDKVFFLFVENLAILIRHSVPVDYVAEGSVLVTKQQWEGVYDVTPSYGDVFVVHEGGSLSVGRINHINPSLSCNQNSGIEKGNHEYQIDLISEGDCEYNICKNTIDVVMSAYSPFLETPKFALGIGVMIGGILLIVFSLFYCYSYCKLKKDYEILKEQSMSMSHYKYESPNKKKNVIGREAEPVPDNILGEIYKDAEGKGKEL